MKVRAHQVKLLAVMFLAVLPGCTSVPVESVKLQGSSAVKIEAAGSDLINGYRQWTRVNPQPVLLQLNVAQACAIATLTPPEKQKRDPHKDKFITVYVNPLGTKAMMQEKNPRFPQGSVIVKEKLPSKDSSSPELLTVMIKREAGFNPENGDWEYMAVDGAVKTVQARGRLENCQACHTIVKDTDFVYRSYLPSDLWEKLK